MFRNTHEAIIDDALFELVQEKRGTYRPRRTSKKRFGLFSSIAHCMDCGYVHHYNQREGYTPFYYCGGASKRIKICESYHNIQEKVLAQYVLEDIRRLTAMIQENEPELVSFLERMNNQVTHRSVESDEQLLQKSEQRYLELDKIIQRLYEDNVSGKVSDSRYMKMSTEYEQEQVELKEKITFLHDKVVQKEERESGVERFVQKGREYLNPQKLKTDMVRALIERVEIGKKMKVNGKCEQKINIIYRFVGNLSKQNISQ